MAKKKNRRPITIGFYALGCPKAIVDSERMLAQIARAGLFITAEPDNADVIVVNTCGFIAPAIAESLEVIRHATDCKTAGSVKKVIVAGCLPERMGRQLFDRNDSIDAVVGLGWREAIARIIKETLRCEKPIVYLNQPACSITDKVHDDRARLLIGPRHWAYLRISEGCNHKCSFCTIPAIRGRFRSKPLKLVLAEAAELGSAGVVELNIIAQDTTNWGRDLKPQDGLTGLLSRLEKIPELRWLRLMYAYPAGIDDRLIETIAESEKIVHYIDMPIQHINDKILKDMRRPDTRERICSLIEKLRRRLPDIVLRTTLIVGFPGETDRQFDELLDFVKWAEFDCLGCFKFCPESDTPAAEMPDQVPELIKQQRVEELMLAQQRIAFAKNSEQIGAELVCLVDSADDRDTAQGRFYGQAPDVDSICIIKNCSANTGDFINTRVVDTSDYDLIVEQS